MVVCFMVSLLFVIVGLTAYPNALGADVSPEEKAVRKAFRKGLEDSLGMPVLSGEIWQKMAHDSKVAFIWGVGHVVTIEQYLMEKYPELKRDSFVVKVVEGMADVPMNEVVARVDKHYQEHPDELDEPVMKIIWKTMIKPNLKTGIAGRPIEDKP